MLTKGLKKGFCFVIILAITLGVLGIGKAEASRRPLKNEVMKAGMISNRKVEIGGKLFDICVNQTERTITIKGLVEDWDEMDRIENYFKNSGPSDYQVTCQLDFGY